MVKSGQVLRLYSGLDAAIIDLGDHRLAFDPNDWVIGATIWRQGGWFRQETMRVFEAIPKGGVFVDVGANIGTQTLYALKFGGFDRAVCFEPEPKNLRSLRINLLINDLTDRVSIVEAAAGAKEGMAFRWSDKVAANQYPQGRDLGSDDLLLA